MPQYKSLIELYRVTRTKAVIHPLGKTSNAYGEILKVSSNGGYVDLGISIHENFAGCATIGDYYDNYIKKIVRLRRVKNTNIWSTRLGEFVVYLNNTNHLKKGYIS